MNNTRADMYHDLVCEHRKLSDAHSKLQLELSQKGKHSRYIHICRMHCLLFSAYILPAYLNKPTLNLLPTFRSWCRSPSHRACQEGEGADRYAGFCNFLPLPLYFKSFNSYHCFLSSHYFDFKSFQMRNLHWRHVTRTAHPQWMWPSNWMTGMPPTRPRLSS
jgi:hypothetical protein